MNILAYGEVMMRLNPANYKKIAQTDSLDFSFTGTGLNILAGLYLNGYQTNLLTSLPNNNLGKAAAANIRRLGVSDKLIQFNGDHLGIYLLELGYGGRPSEVTYLNREHSSFNQLELSDELIQESLEKVDILHICGITLSTSEISRKNALKLAKYAEDKGITLCFDFNFRASLNEGTDKEKLRECYQFLLSRSSIVFGSLRDLTELLLIEGETDEDIIKYFVSTYKIDYFAGTLRKKLENVTSLQGFIYESQTSNYIFSDSVSYEVLDRIGTGDAYVSAVLTGIIERWPLDQIVEYATYNAKLAHTTMGDSPILSKEFVLSYIKNQSDVIR